MPRAALSHYDLGVIFWQTAIDNKYVFRMLGTLLLSNSDIKTQVSRYTMFYTLPHVTCDALKKKICLLLGGLKVQCPRAVPFSSPNFIL